jgi:hypothetical protein
MTKRRCPSAASEVPATAALAAKRVSTPLPNCAGSRSRRGPVIFRSESDESELNGEKRILVVVQDVSERKQLESEIIEIANTERRRLGADLHDGLGQELTGISLMLRSRRIRSRSSLLDCTRGHQQRRQARSSSIDHRDAAYQPNPGIAVHYRRWRRHCRDPGARRRDGAEAHGVSFRRDWRSHADQAAAGWRHAGAQCMPSGFRRRQSGTRTLVLRRQSLRRLRLGPAAAQQRERQNRGCNHQKQTDRVQHGSCALAHSSIHHDRQRRVGAHQHQGRVEVRE